MQSFFAPKPPTNTSATAQKLKADAEKGDDASIMRAHAVLSECGVAMGLWDLNKLPTKAPGDAMPVGAAYSTTAELPRPRYYNATQIQAKEPPRRVSLDLANASTTSLKNAPSLSSGE